jgi:hypothetical protein
MSEDERVQYLRDRGVEVEFPGDRAKARDKAASASASASGPPFSFVYIPSEATTPVAEMTARSSEEYGDTLPSLLAPAFADDAEMDETRVARETTSRLQNMFMGGADAQQLKAPSAGAIQKLAAGGACEAYPLCQPTEANGHRAVRLYIDEVGALRGRPRNQRAEDLATSIGLGGLSIHGDAFVGRCERQLGDGVVGERNVDFKVAELDHSASWVS